ncbi:WS/DGAT domain-containing protein [Gordonia sp. SID5947]|uniref:WS/DGAT domain-containing protein n=1 Tax=Gordonia sp. SID5947 TaxID=2690315 RepID=UPI001927F25A|nr:WS/DGAT domain-containing protein [Gordonia sp. SID5947]
MEPADSRMYWLSAAIPNDQFLLYCFVDQQVPMADLAEGLRRRAGRVADLCLRVCDVPLSLDQPLWVHRPVTPDQVVVHAGADTWQRCLERVGSLMADQLVPTRSCWRLHLLGPVTDTPRGPAVVAVLQIVHSLGDGRRTSRIARDLFGDHELRTVAPPERDRLPPALAASSAAVRGGLAMPVRVGQMLWRGMCAFRAVRDRPPSARPGYALTRLNRPSGTQRALRVIVGDRTMLPAGDTVTTGVLTAISIALEAYLGRDVAPIGAELTIGRTRDARARNNFRNAGIDLHLEEADPAERARHIAAEMARAAEADDEPARIAERRASDTTPAILSHWGTRQFDPDRRPETVTGVTVVSSVYRGAADLTLGGGPVQFTTGFPALSPAQGLTHGVHGIGTTVAISVTTSPEIMPDVDRYIELLRAALERVATIDGRQDSGGPSESPGPDRG